MPKRLARSSRFFSSASTSVADRPMANEVGSAGLSVDVAASAAGASVICVALESF